VRVKFWAHEAGRDNFAGSLRTFMPAVESHRQIWVYLKDLGEPMPERPDYLGPWAGARAKPA